MPTSVPHINWADVVEQEKAPEDERMRAAAAARAAASPASGRGGGAGPAPAPERSSAEILAAGWEEVTRGGSYGGNSAEQRPGELRAGCDDWHEGMSVERGSARARLDLSHGFLKFVERNQRDRCVHGVPSAPSVTCMCARAQGERQNGAMVLVLRTRAGGLRCPQRSPATPPPFPGTPTSARGRRRLRTATRSSGGGSVACACSTTGANGGEGRGGGAGRATAACCREALPGPRRMLACCASWLCCAVADWSALFHSPALRRPEHWRSFPAEQQPPAELPSQADAADWWRRPVPPDLAPPKQPPKQPARILSKQGQQQQRQPQQQDKAGGVGRGGSSRPPEPLPSPAARPRADPARMLLRAAVAAAAGRTQPASSMAPPPPAAAHAPPHGVLPPAVQTRLVGAMPVMAALEGGGYAMVHPGQRQQQATLAAAAQAQAQAQVQAQAQAQAQQAAPALPSEPLPDAGRKPLRVREGYIAYTPPPRLAAGAAGSGAEGSAGRGPGLTPPAPPSRQQQQRQLEKQHHQGRRAEDSGKKSPVAAARVVPAPRPSDPQRRQHGKAVLNMAQQQGAPGLKRADEQQQQQRQQQQRQASAPGLQKKGSTPALANGRPAKLQRRQQQQQQQQQVPLPALEAVAVAEADVVASSKKKKKKKETEKEEMDKRAGREQGSKGKAVSEAAPPLRTPPRTTAEDAPQKAEGPPPVAALRTLGSSGSFGRRRSGGTAIVAEQDFGAEAEGALCS